MGLCKCPKKKVTNLFCFEHRVNVCEHCLVANHNKCIVQSYLQWLQDSDYTPDCGLCSKSLSDESCGECVRLVCYDVFHFVCLNQYAQRLPANTAPAGYTCPHCSAGIFPPSNMVSPVADSLRTLLSKVNWARAGLGMPLFSVVLGNVKKCYEMKSTCPHCSAGIFPPSNMVSPVADSLRTLLSKVNWARAGLGMPLIEEAEPVSVPALAPTSAPQTQSVTPNGDINSQHRPQAVSATESTPPPTTSTELTNVSTLGATPAPNTTRPSAQVSPYTTSTPIKARDEMQLHNVINVDAGTSARGLEKGYNMSDPRKLFDTTKGDIFNLSHDHDDDKYRRRPAMDWLNRWLRSRDTGGKRGPKKDPMSVRKKFLVVLLIGIIGFITVIIIFSRLSQGAADDDPFLDPMANPNIRVHEDGAPPGDGQFLGGNGHAKPDINVKEGR